MYELVIILLVVSSLLLLCAVVVSVLAYVYRRDSNRYEFNLRVVQKAYESLKKTKDILEKLVGKNNIEIDALKIEVDANIEQLGAERENHTVREDQMKRIKNILEEEEEGDEE